jgi:hypothetical protein
MWSGFWLQSPNEGQFIGDASASGAEIDICEHRNTDTGNVDDINGQAQSTVHWVMSYASVAEPHNARKLNSAFPHPATQWRKHQSFPNDF